MNQPLVYFYPFGHEKHHYPGHPERPDRIQAIVGALRDAGLWDDFPHLEPVLVGDPVLFAIHSSSLLADLEQAARRDGYYDQDTFLTPASFSLALSTAGGALSVARQVWLRQADTGFALCRPPGHHATPHRAMGFCLLNNVALAAQDLILNFRAQKLAIIDLDLHHGNGTQDIFYHRPDVFYFSTHQSPLYPGTGFLHEQGEGDGYLTTANFPMPPGIGDTGYSQILDGAIFPLLDRFRPEMLLISAGFDAHWMDPLGFLQITAAGYGWLIERLKSWADANCSGRIALFLEGGYNLRSVAACAHASVSALLGLPYSDSIGGPPLASSNGWIKLLAQARELWML